MDLITRWDQLKAQIEARAILCQRDPATIRLLAVSKGQGIDSIMRLAEAGQMHFAESYCQEAIKKIRALQAYGLTWHFIGPVQRNKVKGIAEYFDTLHSLDRLSVAEALEQALAPLKKNLNVLVQVNISEEPKKSGVGESEVVSLVEKLRHYPHLNFQGLMGMRPVPTSLRSSDQSFEKLVQIQHQLKERGIACPRLSMGMSQDYLKAITCGSTDLRIGSALFKAQ